MEILEAYDLTGLRAFGGAAGRDGPQDRSAYVMLREAGADPAERRRRPREVDEFAAKVEELVGRSGGRIRADVVHRRLTAMGTGGRNAAPGGLSRR